MNLIIAVLKLKFARFCKLENAKAAANKLFLKVWMENMKRHHGVG